MGMEGGKTNENSQGRYYEGLAVHWAREHEWKNSGRGIVTAMANSMGEGGVP